MGSTLGVMMESCNDTTTKTVSNGQSVGCPICGGSQIVNFLEAPDRFHLRRELYHLVRCVSCSCVWQTSPPDAFRMGDHYTEDYHKAIVAAGEGSAMRRWKNQVKRISAHKTGGALLDLGCSSGGFLSTMRGNAWKLYGIEMEESTAERARAATGAEVFVGDVLDAPFPAESFDVITCFDVLEHVYNPRQFLTRVHQWLKPGGIFYAMMPNIDSWEARLFGTYWFGLELPRHIFHFSPQSLRCLMNALEFEEISIATPRTSYVERSTNYVSSRLIEKAGFTPSPQAKMRPQNLLKRAVRKALRLALLAPFAEIASLASAGPSMEGVFRRANRTR